MATLVLSAAGAALGGSFGGSLFGISTLVAGKAVGATLGAALDQKLLGQGSATVEAGRVDRLRVMGSSEGAPLPRVFGRMRVPGQLIWSSRFLESVSTQRIGGKGSRSGAQTVREYSYSISLALALCEGEVARIGRIWADGQPLSQASLTLRLHGGVDDQLPDPLIAAIEGADEAPAYRGTAYVVLEDLDLAPFGNRIPQLNFEVFRRVEAVEGLPAPASHQIRGVALVPGTGEYSLATAPVSIERRRGETVVTNVNNDRGIPDLVASLEQLDADLPSCEAISLVVSWFGDDLRVDRCDLYPAVEQKAQDGETMPWRVSGLGRSAAREVSRVDGRPIFGGTPADDAVVQAIRHMADAGKAVMFYPFILMDIQSGNGRENPWDSSAEQPAVPWRGRITLSKAPGVGDSPDQTAGAAAEVEAFFGRAEPGDFVVLGDSVSYAGPDEWSYRRFILHYAHLCAVAGRIDAFCIGSEMRGLTQIRDGRTSYPAVRALKALAADVRSILGQSVRIGYAADWSEYFGHQPQDGSGDVLFHLDPLWADPNIDFVGIDNYMPISDWREGGTHADAQAGSPYQLDYLAGNVAGGEGFDWYYADAEARAQQERTPISDGAHAEPWVYRYKDLRSWWNTPHHDRIGGVRSQQTTGWVPRSKPFWFTELGCPAVDKGTNQPNVFYDAKSSESFLPHYSDGSKDEYLQQRYFQSVLGYWGQTSNNPWSEAYGGRMVRLDRAFCWAWDARPWPEFPDRLETWVDGTNYAVGHWLNGRVSLPSVASVVAALASNTSARLDLDEVHGLITGYVVAGVESGRQSLQSLQIAYDLQAVVSGDALIFRTGWHGSVLRVSPDRLVREGQSPTCTKSRSANTELATRVTLTYVRSAQDYQAGAAEMVEPVQSAEAVSELSVPLVLEEVQADEIVARWLSCARSARDTLTLAFPWSMVHLTAGDVFQLDSPEGPETLRVERVAEQQARQIAASRVSRTAKGPAWSRPEAGRRWTIRQPTAAFLQFLDLPLIMGDESPHAPYAAVVARPWAEPIALYSATQDHAYELNHIFERPSRVGRLLDPLPVGYPGLWNGWSGRVELDWGALAAAGEADVLNGANLCALRPSNGEDWEVVQFAEAQLVAPAVYRIDRLLRGQLGTDAVARPLEAGADIVLLDSGVPQLEVAASARGIDRHYRFGPLSRAYSDSSFRHLRAAFRGVGLRPLSPVHIRARRLENGDVEVRWVRRTRVGGDGWMGLDVPWGEERLTFEIAVRHEGTRARTEQVSEPRFIYSRSAQTEDGVVGSTSFEVAQLSDAFGRGPARTMTLAATQMAS